MILKNARGHAFFEFVEPMLADPDMSGLFRWRITDMGHFLPEVGSRMLTRVMTGQDLCGSWVIVQDETYRYTVAQQGCMRVRSVIAEYLATEVYWSNA